MTTVKRFKWKSCSVKVEEEGDMAIIAMVESADKNKGHATELLLQIKELYDSSPLQLWGSPAVSPAMARVYEKTEIDVLEGMYEDEDVIGYGIEI